MVDKIIGMVKKQDRVDYNKLGYKIIDFSCNINVNLQEYYITVMNINGEEYGFLCGNINNLNNLLKNYGFDNILEVK